MDICDCYNVNFGAFDTFEIEDLVDIGDMSKFDSLISKKNDYKTRYFNSITETDKESIVKRSTCSYGDTLITDEMRFYKYHHGYSNLPRIIEFGKHFYEMEKVKGTTVYEYSKNLSHKDQINVVRNILSLLNELNSLEMIHVSKNQVLTDIDIEFRRKIDKRLESVSPLLDEFNFIKSVNGLPIKYSVKHIKNDLYTKLQDYFMNRTEYRSIHGDPHMSNIMIGDKFYFIDPRGYFGKTKLFGPSEYDTSKVLYSLSGFDYFNTNEKTMFYIDGSDISLDIVNAMDPFLNLFENSSVLMYMTILHWLGLSDYTKMNIHKCVSAFYYGIFLYHNYIV